MLLNNKWITEEIKKIIRKNLEKNDKKKMMIQSLWGLGKMEEE